ncbi:MAG: zinc ABC transporter substrate-binding protein [Alphaproteobacteria bacterium]|jgi:zinc/manganese transport system substrate-binding protein|nr:zinc ABC transporter substrate-binding protein [Thalassospira sp.]MCE2965830.1 zinc ABC transporter substrate-binding protein [Alphaproteobacteria bacterium]
MKSKLFFITLVLLFNIGLTAAQAAPLKVVASFTIVGDLAKQVGGDDVEVKTLVGADSDAHVFQPTPNDAKALKEADVIIINGLGFEGWINRLIESSGTKAAVIVASNGIEKTLKMEEHEEHAGHHHHKHNHSINDPHAWQSIQNGRQYVKNIAAGLVAADAENAADYTKRAAALDSELAALDAWTKAQIETVPAEKRSVITTHEAFGYFADAYKVTFLAPNGLNTEDEPSAKELKALVKQIKSGKTRALFIENMSNANVIKQLATESGAVVGAKLYADALSGENGAAPTYQAMFRYNVTALVNGMKQN